MKKKSILVLIVLFMSIGLSVGFAVEEKPAEYQSRKGQKAIYLEALGNGGLGTLNYEQFLADGIAIRVGGMILPIGAERHNSSKLATVMAVLVNSGKKKKLFLEFGVGVVFYQGAFMANYEKLTYITGTLGIRYQPKPKGILLRFGFTPAFYVPWFGASIGFVF